MIFSGQFTNIASGLRLARQTYAGRRGSRPNTENVVIMLTDGRANIEVNNLNTEVGFLHALLLLN